MTLEILTVVIFIIIVVGISVVCGVVGYASGCNKTIKDLDNDFKYMFECDACGFEFNATKGSLYIVKGDKTSLVSPQRYYEAMDCPICSSQKIIKPYREKAIINNTTYNKDGEIQIMDLSK